MFTRLMALTMIVSVPLAAYAAETATVNITGKIVDNTCTIKNTNKTIDVDLETVHKKSFSSVGNTQARKPFVVKLKDCSSATQKVVVTATGTFDADIKEAFKLTSGSTAIGVAVQILDKKEVVLKPNDPTSKSEYILATSTKTVNNGSTQETVAEQPLDFYAEYIQTQATVNTGSADSTVTLNLDYN